MIADGAGEQNLVADTHGARIDCHAGKQAPDAGRRDVHVVGLAVLDDFGIAGGDSHAGSRAASAMARTSASRTSVGRPASST